MKLKRCIASATALAMTVSVMAFAPMTAEAAPVDRPNGTESVKLYFRKLCKGNHGF